MCETTDVMKDLDKLINELTERCNELRQKRDKCYSDFIGIKSFYEAALEAFNDADDEFKTHDMALHRIREAQSIIVGKDDTDDCYDDNDDCYF